MKLKFFQYFFRIRLHWISMKKMMFLKGTSALFTALVLLLNMVFDFPSYVFASPGHDGGHSNEEAISGSASEYPVVTVFKAKPADQLKQNIEASGEILPYQESDVFALREGVVQDLSLNVGDVVSKGQVLGNLYADVSQVIYNAELKLAQAEQDAAQKRRRFLESIPASQRAQLENSLSFAKEGIDLAEQIKDKTASQIETELEVLGKSIESSKIQQESKLSQIDVQISSAQQRLKQAQLATVNGISDLISSADNLLFTQPGCITSIYGCNQGFYRGALYFQNSSLVTTLEGSVREFYKDFLALQSKEPEAQSVDLDKITDLLNRALDLAQDVRAAAIKATSINQTEEEIIELKKRVDESTDHLVELSNGIIDSLAEINNAEAEKIQLKTQIDQEIVRLGGEVKTLQQEREKSAVEQNTILSEKVSSKNGLEKQLDIFSVGVDQQFLEGDLDVAIKTAQTQSIRQKIGAGRSIVAPFSGTIAKKYVNEGASVDFEKPVYRIVNDQRKFVRFFVKESDLIFVNKDAEISLSITSASSVQFSAKIARISPSLDQETRTILVEADLLPSEQNEKILAHMNVRVQIPISTDPSLKVIPEKALELSDGKSVWIVNQNVEIENRPVSVRFISEGFAYVESGLESEWIVIKSPVELQEKLAVETKL